MHVANMKNVVNFLTVVPACFNPLPAKVENMVSS